MPTSNYLLIKYSAVNKKSLEQYMAGVIAMEHTLNFHNIKINTKTSTQK